MVLDAGRPSRVSSLLQRSDTNFEEVLLCTSSTSALMSWTLKVTPFLVTGCLGSGMRIDAGDQAWQMPHQVGMQRPLSALPRLAHSEPSLRSLHSLESLHSLRSERESMPW